MGDIISDVQLFFLWGWRIRALFYPVLDRPIFVVILGGFFLWKVRTVLYELFGRPKHVSLIGLSGPLGQWLSGLHYVIVGPQMILDQYKKGSSAQTTPRVPFAVPTPNSYLVVVSSETQIREVCSASENHLSTFCTTEDILQPRRMLDGSALTIPSHASLQARVVKIIELLVTRNLPLVHSILHEQIQQGLLEDHARPCLREWQSAPLFRTARQIVAELNGRVVFGLALMREKEFYNAVVQYPGDMSLATRLMQQCLTILTPVLNHLPTSDEQRLKIVWKHLYGLVETHQADTTHEELIDSRLSSVDGVHTLLRDLLHTDPWAMKRVTRVIFSIWATSLHQCGVALTHALYNLCIHPGYISALRKEIEEQTKDGWDGAVDRMELLDSFLKESSRLNPSDSVQLTREVVQPYTFSDSVHVPVGNRVCVPGGAILRDPALYPDPEEFNGFRFVHAHGQREHRAEDGEHKSSRGSSQFTETSTSFPLWGVGKRACPGRFYASNVLKTVLAHILLSYDIKLADRDRIKPRTFSWCSSLIPVTSTKLLFRHRSYVPHNSCKKHC